MKNKISIVFVVFLMSIFVFTSFSYGYVGNKYQVDISDKYEVAENDNIVMFQESNTGDNIVIQEIENTFGGKNLTSYQINQMVEAMLSQYKTQYNGDVVKTNQQTHYINGYTVVNVTFTCNFTIDETSYDVFQDVYIFISKKYIHQIVFSSMYERNFSSLEKDKIISSFWLLEDLTEDEKNDSNIGINISKIDWDFSYNNIFLYISILEFIIIVFETILIIKENSKKGENKNVR